MTEETNESLDRPTTEPRVTPFRATVALAALALITLLAGLFLLSATGLWALGGTCAEGGPFEIQRRCPPGPGAILALGLPAELILIFIYAGFKPKAWPSLTLWFFPVAFIGFGIMFIASAFSAPIGIWVFSILIGLMMIGMGMVPVLGVYQAYKDKPLKQTIRKELVPTVWIQLAALAAGLVLALPVWRLIS